MELTWCTRRRDEGGYGAMFGSTLSAIDVSVRGYRKAFSFGKGVKATLINCCSVRCRSGLLAGCEGTHVEAEG